MAFGLRKKYKEDEWLPAKRVSQLSSHATNPRVFLNKNIQDYVFRPRISKSKMSKNFSMKPINKRQFVPNTEVVVKITSSSKSFEAVCKHIDYITRNGEIEALVNNQTSFFSYEHQLQTRDRKFIKNIYKDSFDEIKNYLNSGGSRVKNGRRETFNIVFSMKDYKGVNEFSFNPEIVKKAAYKTIKGLYPDNDFALVLHADTNNPHCHLCLRIAKKDGTRIDIRKNDLYDIRKHFSNALNDLGVKATATYKKDRPSRERSDLSKYPKTFNDDLETYKNPKAKAYSRGFFEIVNFGKANYNFAENANESFFVSYLSKKYKLVTLWSKDLERVVEENDIKVGDFCKFKKLGTEYKEEFSQVIRKNSLFEVNQIIPMSKFDCNKYDPLKSKQSKEKFDEFEQKEPPKIKKKMQFIKSLKDNDERPNKLNNYTRAKENSTRRYSREEWAKFYANKARTAQRGQPSLYLSRFIAHRPNLAPRTANDLRTLSNVYLDFKQDRRAANTELLLQRDELHQLSKPRTPADNGMRRANQSNAELKQPRRNLTTQTTKQISKTDEKTLQLFEQANKYGVKEQFPSTAGTYEMYPANTQAPNQAKEPQSKEQVKPKTELNKENSKKMDRNRNFER